jgi:hypothetical protein
MSIPNWPSKICCCTCRAAPGDRGRAQARPYRDRPQLARAQRTRTSASLPGSSPIGPRAADAHKRVPTGDRPQLARTQRMRTSASLPGIVPNWPASSGRAQARPYQRSCPQLAREQRTRTSASLPEIMPPIGPRAADAHKRVPTGIVPNWPVRSGRTQARPYRDRPQLARAQRTRTSASLPGTVPLQEKKSPGLYQAIFVSNTFMRLLFMCAA